MIKCQHLWDIPVAERAMTIANLSALLFILNEHTSGNLQALILRVHMSHNMVMFIRFKTTNRKFKEPTTTSKATTWKGPKLQNTFHFSTKVEHDHLPYIICKLSTRDLTTYNISISEIRRWDNARPWYLKTYKNYNLHYYQHRSKWQPCYITILQV